MPLQYDERQKTRVYRREQSDAAETRPYDERIGFTQPLTKPKGVFDGISIAQVVAGAAAAATSMLLASKIGIAGSVIGAAVSSAVTVICSQLYRRALEKSAEKLKLDQLGLGANTAQANGSAGYGAGNPYRAVTPNADGARRVARIAPAELRMRAAEERLATQRKVLLASVVLAVAAVTLTAGAILLSTAGQGLGERPAPLLPALSQQQAGHGTPTDTGAVNNGQGHSGVTSPAPNQNGNSETTDGDGTDQQPNDNSADDGDGSEQPGKPNGESGAETEYPGESSPDTDSGTDSDAETGTGTGANNPTSR